MDRRGFLKALGVGAVVAAAPFPLRQLTESVTQAQREMTHEARTRALVESMRQTREMVIANVLNNAFG